MPELAEMTGIGESTLYDYESGRTSPTLRALEKIAKAMGVRIRDLYTEQNCAKDRKNKPNVKNFSGYSEFLSETLFCGEKQW